MSLKRDKVKLHKIFVFLLLILFLGSFTFGIITIIQSEDKAVNLVTEATMEIEDRLDRMDQIEESIALYSKEYKKRGAVVLIASSLGLISIIGELYRNKKRKE